MRGWKGEGCGRESGVSPHKPCVKAKKKTSDTKTNKTSINSSGLFSFIVSRSFDFSFLHWQSFSMYSSHPSTTIDAWPNSNADTSNKITSPNLHPSLSASSTSPPAVNAPGQK